MKRGEKELLQGLMGPQMSACTNCSLCDALQKLLFGIASLCCFPTVQSVHILDGAFNCGLSATALANRFDGLHSRVVPSGYYARGYYFTLSNTRIRPFNHLIYQIPEDGGLGVHVTLDLDGQVRFGPDVEWIEGIDDISSFLNRFDYSVCVNRSKRFYPEIRKYYPNLKDGSLEPGYAGIRPKLSGPRQSPVDFLIQGEDAHGVPSLC